MTNSGILWGFEKKKIVFPSFRNSILLISAATPRGAHPPLTVSLPVFHPVQPIFKSLLALLAPAHLSSIP